jgi:transketolase
MDPLVVTAGTALVAAMATDAWQQARSAALELWRRVHPERVPAIEGELAEVRQEVLTARSNQDGRAEEVLAEDWQRRLERLLRTDPELAQELRRVLDEQLAPLLSRHSDPWRHGSVSMHATAGDHARIVQGRDITIHN